MEPRELPAGEKRFFDKVATLSLLYSLLVVFIHAYNADTYGLEAAGGLPAALAAGVENALSQNLSRIAVPSFFMISGFLFFRNVNGADVAGKIKKRLYTVGVPYLLWNGIYMAYFAVLTRIPAVAGHMSMERVALTLPNILRGIALYRYNPVYWYVCYLLGFFLLSPVLLPLLRSRWAGAAALGVLLAAGAVIPHSEKSILESLAFFMVGGYAARHLAGAVMARYPRKIRWLGAAGLAAAEIIYAAGGEAFNAYFVFCCLSALSCWLLLDVAIPGGLLRKAAISFFIYSCHELILENVEKVVYLTLPHTAGVALAAYFAAPALTVALVYALSAVLRRRLPGLWRALNGGR